MNRRPVAFKDSLRDGSTNVPQAITAEMLIHGFSLPSVNLIPPSPNTDKDPDFSIMKNSVAGILTYFDKMHLIREKLIKKYSSEFLGTLLHQSIGKDKYKPIANKEIVLGDIVLIKDPMMKCVDFPMGIVTKIVKKCFSLYILIIL